MRSYFPLFLFALFSVASALGQDAAKPTVIPLWEGGAPGFEARKDEAEKAESYWVKNVHNPSLTVFLPPKEKATGAAVVICPGGGHKELVFNAEGVDAAKFFNDLGVAAFVLKYRLGREPMSPYKIDVHAKEDGQRAMRLVRNKASEFGIDPKRIGLMGFSAGGEVVSMVCYDVSVGKPFATDPIDRGRLPSRFSNHDLLRSTRNPWRNCRRRATRVSARCKRRSRRDRNDAPSRPKAANGQSSDRVARPRQRRSRLQHGQPLEVGFSEYLAQAPGGMDGRLRLSQALREVTCVRCFLLRR